MGEFEELVLAAAGSIEAMIPAAPAAELGRYEPHQWPGRPEYGTPAQRALDDFTGLTSERLLGALELGVARLELTAPGSVVAGLTPPPDGHGFGIMTMGGESALRRPVSMVAGMHPGAIELITEHTREMFGLLDLSEVSGDEAEIVARHGSAHLAVAVAVSTAVLRAIGTPCATDPLAAIGIAIGVTALILPSVPKPPAYGPAHVAKKRAEYRGGSWHPSLPVSDHEFVVVEEPSSAKADFSATGLVAAVETGFAVRTGAADGEVSVAVQVLLEGPREPDLSTWDEVAEISYTAVNGEAEIGYSNAPPWGGEFRVRVFARGRDGDDTEAYALEIWPAPHAEPLVHKKTDRVGHLLRGEPEPATRVFPEAGFRWLADSLGEAGTITIITNVDVDDVVDTFEEDSVALELDGGVIVVEYNNFQGSLVDKLVPLSRDGKAASYFWNVNRVTRLTFARAGELLDRDDPEVATALADLDFLNHRHVDAKGITAVVRFTGAVIPRDDLSAAIDELVSSC